MKLEVIILSVLSVGVEVVKAFPSSSGSPLGLLDVVSSLGQEVRNVVGDVVEGTEAVLLDALVNPIDVSGDHAFLAPDFAAGDQRGPCPGLNALANHGYIPRSGVVSFTEAISAINSVYGMGLDLAASLAVLGTVWVGNPLSLDPGFSIGGATTSVANILDGGLGLLGTPRGLFGSHNIIEGDSSNTRNDLYMTGDAWTLDMDKFMAFYNMSSDPIGDYDMDIMAERANIRFTESIAENPNFYYGPFTGLIARNAGYIFAGRVLANHTSERPEGIMTKETLKSFFAITGEEGNFVYNYGYERIPENWHKSPVDYGLVELNLDTVSWILKYPQLGSIGGNTGTVNSFMGVNPGNLTGGIFESTTLLENNNLFCFAFEIVKLAAPNSLSSIFSVLDVPLKLVTDTLGSSLLNFSCPALTDLTVGGKNFLEGLEDVFPGVAKSGSAF